MSIFEVDDNNKVSISPEARQIKYFKVIIERDRGGKIPGDSDGRRKYLAMRELAYIYHMADPKSKFTLIPEKEKENEIILALDLPEGWKPDEHVKTAIEKYKYYRETVSERTLRELRKTLEASVDTIQFLRESIENHIKHMREANDPSKLTDLVTLFTTTLTMAKELPKSIENITELEKKVKKDQQESDSFIRGKGELGYYEQ